jgi:hypothetical protein
MKKVLAFLLIEAITIALAADDILLQEKKSVEFRYGADLRVRQEAFDNIPIMQGGVTRGGANNYFRVRPRAWIGADFNEAGLSFDVRLLDEFRHKNVGQESYKFPDEIIFDNLYISFNDWFGEGSTLRIGRQDVMLGTGRLFLEGTAKDGSRSLYFDGARLTLPIAEKRIIDFFCFYTKCEDELAIGHEHRDLTGYAGGYNSMDEATAGLFYADSAIDAFKFGVYYIWKHDTAWVNANGVRQANEDIHTAGFYFKPQFTSDLSAELELAYQYGESTEYDREAFFAFGGIKYTIDKTLDFYLSANSLYMSGDDNGSTDKREDFNILFGRYPWVSELMIFAFDGDGVGTWNNLIQCYIETGLTFANKHKVRLSLGPLFADEANGAGGGSNRGWLGTAKYSFPIFNNIDCYVLGEVLAPEDYYNSSKTAYFLRWELVLKF